MKVSILKAVLATIILLTAGTAIQLFAYFLAEKYLEGTDAIYWIDCVSFFFVLFLILFWIFRVEKVELNMAKEFSSFASAKIVLVVCVLAICIKALDHPIYHFTEIVDRNSTNVIALSDNTQPYNILVPRFLAIVILAPLIEELFFRKYLFSSLGQRYGFFIAMSTSTILFALYHAPNWNAMVSSVLLGVTSSCLLYLTGAILFCVLVHIVVNLLWFLMSTYNNPIVNLTRDLNYGIYYWVVIFSSVFILLLSLFYLRRRKQKINANSFVLEKQ